MVHAGYEASAVLGGNKKLGDTWKMLHWTLSGKMGGIVKDKSANGNGHGGNGHSGNGKRAPVNNTPQQEEAFRIL